MVEETMVEKGVRPRYLNAKIQTDAALTLSATQVTKNSPLQAEKGWVCCHACGLIFFILQKNRRRL